MAPILPLLLLGGLAAAVFASSRKSSAAALPPAPAGTPAAANRFAGKIDAHMPEALVTQVMRALDDGTEAAKLDELAAVLAANGYPVAAASLRDRAMMLRSQETAAPTAKAVEEAMAAPAAATATPAPASSAQVTAQAREIVQTVKDAAAATPSLAPAAAQLATAATTAARAAATSSPTVALEAAQQAVQAATSAANSPAAAAATKAVEVAKAAIISQDPAAAQQAAQMAVDSLKTTTVVLERGASPAPAPAPVSAIATLAARAAENIRSRGCWKEDRSLVRAYQEAEGGSKTVRGRAGLADGMYGPTTALAMMAHLPKVPAPCYWPSQPAAKTAATKQWSDLIRAGKVTVGQNQEAA
jgi:hypothetical protein